MNSSPGWSSVVHRTATLVVALCLAGCGGADSAARAGSSPADDSGSHTPRAVATHAAIPATVDSPGVPVMVGGEEDLDACGGVDTTVSATAVRAGPGDHYPVVGHLERGAQVYACDVSPDGRWEGIVSYPADRSGGCEVSSPIPTRQAYHGTCRSGWVPADSLVLVAG